MERIACYPCDVESAGTHFRRMAWGRPFRVLRRLRELVELFGRPARIPQLGWRTRAKPESVHDTIAPNDVPYR